MLTVLGYAILAWSFLLVIWWVFRLLTPPAGEITVGPFDAVATNLKADGKVLAGIMSSKLQQLKSRHDEQPSGYGFLQIPTMALPAQSLNNRNELAQRLEGLDLKVKDVDVNSVVKLIQAIFGEPATELKGTVTELADAIEFNCQLVRGNTVIASWRSSRTKIAGKDDEVMDSLLDDVLFQFVYDLPRKDELRRWRTGASKDDLPNWQAMEAFVRGLQSLSAYQRDLDHASLVKARNQLQHLQIVAPNYALGLYFYGISLAEDRQEAEAAEVFRQVALSPNTTEYIRLNARLQEAGAHLRLYSTEEAENKALPLLTLLIADLHKKLKTQIKDDERREHEQLLALAEAQSGYTYGTLTELTANPGWYPKAVEHLDKADAIVKAAKDWKPENIKEIEFRILNARGYSKFRNAQHSAVSDFGKECTEAIDLLQQARERRPNHYEVLQNLAMIYDDERYDPSLNSLDNAEGLYRQTILFVPEDYYQYERLARIQYRRMDKSPLSSQKATYAQAGSKYLQNALDRRPSRESHLLAAVFRGELWSTEVGDDAAKKAAAKAFHENVEAALSFSFRKEHRAELVFVKSKLAELIKNPDGEDATKLKKLEQQLDHKIKQAV